MRSAFLERGVLCGVCALLLAAADVCAATASDLQKRLGLPQMTQKDESVAFTDGTNTLRMTIGQRRTEFNGHAVWLNSPLLPDTPAVFTLTQSDLEKVLLPVVRPAVMDTNRTLRVVLDAGHGGADGGCHTSWGLDEKDIALDIAKRVGNRLLRAGFDVVYTRLDDTFIELDDRPRRATNAKADVFVSIHANFAGSASARGCETYTMTLTGADSTGGGRQDTSWVAGNRHDARNTLLGYCIHSRLPGPLGEPDRGLRHARYVVLRKATCPAVLVEIGFLSHEHDARNAAGKWHRERLAAAIADGIVAYAGLQPAPKADAQGSAVDRRIPALKTPDSPPTAATNALAPAATSALAPAATSAPAPAATSAPAPAATNAPAPAATNALAKGPGGALSPRAPQDEGSANSPQRGGLGEAALPPPLGASASAATSAPASAATSAPASAATNAPADGPGWALLPRAPQRGRFGEAATPFSPFAIFPFDLRSCFPYTNTLDRLD